MEEQKWSYRRKYLFHSILCKRDGYMLYKGTVSNGVECALNAIFLGSPVVQVRAAMLIYNIQDRYVTELVRKFLSEHGNRINPFAHMILSKSLLPEIPTELVIGKRAS